MNKRPGLVGLNRAAARTQYDWLAAFMLEQLQIDEFDRINPFLLDEWDDLSFMNWYEKIESDAIVTHLTRVRGCLDRFAVKASEDVGLA